MIEKLIEIQLSLVGEVKKLKHSRYLLSKINWKNSLVGIVGARGVGKTTLLLQYYLKNFDSPQDCLYFSADNINVVNSGLYNLAEEFFKLGGQVVLIDEVHKYPKWQQEIKNVYDSFPNKQIVFSGSSSVNILKGKGDLSRRVVFYDLRGLSFREFILFKLGKKFEAVDLDVIIKDHLYLSEEVNFQISVLRYFREYLQFGYYPFFLEGKDSFYHWLNNVGEKIFYEDIPVLFNVKPSAIYGLKKLFYVVATSQPFAPNISKLSSQLNISKEYIYRYIDELQNANLFTLLYSKEKGFKLMRKPEKIYLENSNLFYLVRQNRGLNIETGSIRESFFISQVKDKTHLYYTPKADFIDNNGRLFEIGGKNKKTQNPEIFYAVDDLTAGLKNRIPLWLFGFLY
jgi:hypothetical protein